MLFNYCFAAHMVYIANLAICSSAVQAHDHVSDVVHLAAS
jgi:hypothetical protein